MFARVAREGHAGIIGELPCAAEQLDAEDRSFDLVFSDATLEHLYEHERAIGELFRVTAPGGAQLHQVDYRDHRDFSKPLEYLLLPKAEYAALAASCNNETGCQHRAHEHEAMFRAAGFDPVKNGTIHRFDDAVLDDFLPRLSASSAEWRTAPREHFAVMCALLVAHRPA